MDAQTILSTAAGLIQGDRQQTHGDVARTQARIARYWSAYLGIDVSGADVALMMALLKIARTQAGAHNPDNYVDQAAYGAIAGQIAATEALARQAG